MLQTEPTTTTAKIMCFSISYKDVAAVKDNNEICIALSQPRLSYFYLCVMYSKHELKVNFIHKIKSFSLFFSLRKHENFHLCLNSIFILNSFVLRFCHARLKIKKCRSGCKYVGKYFLKKNVNEFFFVGI